MLLLGGPIALLLASLAGYGVAAGALRPVEHMRRRAAELFASGEAGRRLPVPPAHDEISNLGTTLNEMLARIDRAFERERAFTSDASHELRTPLSILKTEVDLALERGRSREELVAALESVSEETDRLSRLAEDLLVLARADEGRLPLSVEPLELGALAQRVGGRFAARAAAEGRALSIDGDGGARERGPAAPRPGAHQPDRQRAPLRRGRRRRARVAPRRARRAARDRRRRRPAAGAGGPGLRPLRRARSTRAGAGLGLSIVAAIAAAHGGSVHADTRPEGGADVWISLPAAD